MNQSDARFIQGEFRPFKVDKIRELESKLGVPLPDPYVEFLSQCGGCRFAGKAIVIVSGGRLPIFVFFDEKKLLSKVAVYEDLTAEFNLAIGADLEGNLYVLNCLLGSVYYLDFCVNPPVATKVGDTFDKFLASIQVEPYEDEM